MSQRDYKLVRFRVHGCQTQIYLRVDMIDALHASCPQRSSGICKKFVMFNCVKMMIEIKTIDEGQKDVFLRRANIKNSFLNVIYKLNIRPKLLVVLNIQNKINNFLLHSANIPLYFENYFWEWCVSGIF